MSNLTQTLQNSSKYKNLHTVLYLDVSPHASLTRYTKLDPDIRPSDAFEVYIPSGIRTGKPDLGSHRTQVRVTLPTAVATLCCGERKRCDIE